MADLLRENDALRAALDLNRDPVLLVDPETLRVLWANRSACRALGHPVTELQRMPLAELLLSSSAASLAATFDAVIQAKAGIGAVESRRTSPGGVEAVTLWQVHAAPTASGPVLILVGEPPAQGQSVAPSLDPLTGLPDRRLFLQRLQDAWEESQRQADYAFAVFFIDLDGFKAINDRFGHLHGDRFLREFAGRLSASLRAGDVVARFGGDEFTVLVDRLRSLQDAIRVAERMLADLETPSDAASQKGTGAVAKDPVCRDTVIEATEPPLSESGGLRITASIGIAWSRQAYAGPDDMLEAADRAMYCAKALGPACYACAGEPPSTGS